MSASPPLPRRLMRDEAYRLLREAILDGTLAPGQQIRDAELANQVGLSRTPVREALARLADEGLVESKPQAFTRVTPLARRDAHDAYVLLRALHELAVREAVPRLAESHLHALADANVDFAASLETGDIEAALAADDAFHGVLVRAAGNGAVAATLDRYTPLVRRLERLRFGSPPGRRSIDDHAGIIQACADGDAERAAALTALNWATLGEQIERAFEEGS